MVRGGPNEEDGRKRIDAAVGGLVWVQRRNGSWWPGQIVGLDELSESSLAPRSGTPIRLLGRDDSTVDWYDLEKPKGVKAFRCGEYDACIEKAKAAAAKSSKRSTKYPRRENAIILALEIERTSLFGDFPDPHSPANDLDSEPVLNSMKHSASISHPSKEDEKTNSDRTSTCEGNSHSTQELSHSGISYEEANGSTYLKGQAFKGRRKTPNDSEDDGNEGIKRMKGLDDLGIAAERKVKVLALANQVKSSASVNHARAGNCMSVGTLANGGCMPTSRRKRSQVVHIHELLKRKYRRRPLTKVLENTTMVPVRIICDEFATPFERSDAITPCNECGDDNKAKDVQPFNRNLPEDDSLDMLFDVPFVNEEQCASGMSPIGKHSGPLKPHPGAFRTRSGRNGAVQASTFGHEMVNEPGPTSCATTCMNLKMEKSASKWQSKGKRKARHISKTEEPYSRKKADFNHEKLDTHIIGHENSNGLVNGFTDRRKPTSLASSQRAFPYHQQRFLSRLSYEIPDVSPSGIYADSSLYEVEITVEATRPQMQQVPYISLMSKLNGKPITGHPVTVETLEDGYFDPRVSDYPASGSCELDDEDAEVMAPTVKPKVRMSKHIKRRSHFARCRSSRSKRHGPSSKKTRKLSSLTGPHKLNPVKRKPMVQNLKGPMLACVPLKIVFSRINEALNGSTRSAHHAAILHNT